MDRIKWLKMTEKTPLSNATRDRIARAYGAGETVVEVNPLKKDIEVLVDLGYTFDCNNGKCEVRL